MYFSCTMSKVFESYSKSTEVFAAWWFTGWTHLLQVRCVTSCFSSREKNRLNHVNIWSVWRSQNTCYYLINIYILLIEISNRQNIYLFYFPQLSLHSSTSPDFAGRRRTSSKLDSQNKSLHHTFLTINTNSPEERNRTTNDAICSTLLRKNPSELLVDQSAVESFKFHLQCKKRRTVLWMMDELTALSSKNKPKKNKKNN